MNGHVSCFILDRSKYSLFLLYNYTALHISFKRRLHFKGMIGKKKPFLWYNQQKEEFSRINSVEESKKMCKWMLIKNIKKMRQRDNYVYTLNIRPWFRLHAFIYYNIHWRNKKYKIIFKEKISFFFLYGRCLIFIYDSFNILEKDLLI